MPSIRGTNLSSNDAQLNAFALQARFPPCPAEDTGAALAAWIPPAKRRHGRHELPSVSRSAVNETRPAWVSANRQAGLNKGQRRGVGPAFADQPRLPKQASRKQGRLRAAGCGGSFSSLRRIRGISGDEGNVSRDQAWIATQRISTLGRPKLIGNDSPLLNDAEPAHSHLVGRGIFAKLSNEPITERIGNTERTRNDPLSRRLQQPRNRGRDAHYCAPPAQNRTGGIPAYGSHLGCLTRKR
jgi:hypothetical protein